MSPNVLNVLNIKHILHTTALVQLSREKAYITLCDVIIPQTPLDVDIMLDMTNDGVRLVFDPKSQRLKVSTRKCKSDVHAVYMYMFYYIASCSLCLC